MTKDEFVRCMVQDMKHMAEKAWHDYERHRDFAIEKSPVWAHQELWAPGHPETDLETVIIMQVQERATGPTH